MEPKMGNHCSSTVCRDTCPSSRLYTYLHCSSSIN